MAREKARGAKAIGTTGRGIGPTYEAKVARRGVRFGDLKRTGFLATELPSRLSEAGQSQTQIDE